MRRGGLVLLLAALVSCATTRAQGVDVDGPWIINGDAVGAISLGAPIPAALLADAEAQYFARYIADGVAIEGFELATPPLSVAIRGGPFAKQARTRSVSEPPVDELRDDGARAARAGAKVSAIVVRSDTLKTAGGVGVGSTLDAVTAAHGEAKLRPAPPTFGGDMCNVEASGLPGVSFVFKSCKAAQAGEPVLRVDLWAR